MIYQKRKKKNNALQNVVFFCHDGKIKQTRLFLLVVCSQVYQIVDCQDFDFDIYRYITWEQEEWQDRQIENKMRKSIDDDDDIYMENCSSSKLLEIFIQLNV
jgi:hypothetical protein